MLMRMHRYATPMHIYTLRTDAPTPYETKDVV
jgi:hypothetical protein